MADKVAKVKYHELPPGVSGSAKGYLVMAVDEIIWLEDVVERDSDLYYIRAEWWGSRPEQQVHCII